MSSIENDNNDESVERDLDWIPESDEEQNDIHHDINPAKERKFIVFESCLDNLFTSCCSCGFPCSMSKTVLGSYINIKSSCENCDTQRKWENQPTSNYMPLGSYFVFSRQCSQVFNIVYACFSSDVQYRNLYEDPVFVFGPNYRQ